MAEDRFIKDDRIAEVDPTVADLRQNWNLLCQECIQDDNAPGKPDVASLQFRKNQLTRVVDWIKAHEQEAFEAYGSDLGLSENDVYGSAISHMCSVFQKVLSELNEWTSNKPFESNFLNKSTQGHVKTQGRGVYCIFGSWNVPMHVTLSPMAYAIAAGNCVLIKPSELSPKSSNYMNRLISEVLDQRFYRCIEGAIQTGIKLNGIDFDGFVFTGGTWVGKIIGGACGKNGVHTI